MANPPEVAAFTIDALRAQDEKGQNKEVTPERETLNANRVLNFVHKSGIALNNMDSTYTLDTSIQLTAEGSTKTEKRLSAQLNEAKAILTKYGRLDVMQENSEDVVVSQLENLKTPPKNMTPAEAAKVLEVWHFHELIRGNAKRLLMVEGNMKDVRENELHPHQRLGDAVKDKLHDARGNWDKLSSNQKLAFAGMALIGGALLLRSENEYVKKIKDTLFTGVKIAGVGWMLNKAWYLFTGESAIDAITGTVGNSTKGSRFMMDTFKTDENGAEILNKSMVQIGDNGFMDLLDKYDAAKSAGKTTIEGTKMPPAEAYKAMDVFCNKYNAGLLRKEYGKYSPPIAFSQVMIAEMSKDPDVKLKDNLGSRIIDYGDDKFKRGYNYLASSAAAVWVGQKYRSLFGKDATPEEMSEFTQKFNYIIKDPSKFQETVENKIAAKNLAAGKKFIDCELSGTSDSKYGVKYKEGGDGYMYVIANKDIGTKIKDEKGLADTIESASDSAEAFLNNKYGKNKVNVPKKREVFGSVYIVSDSSMKYLMRYKIN